MSLRLRMLCVMGCGLVLFAGLLYGLLSFFVKQEIGERETREVGIHMQRAVQVLKNESAVLKRKASRWLNGIRKNQELSESGLMEEMRYWLEFPGALEWGIILDEHADVVTAVSADYATKSVSSGISSEMRPILQRIQSVKDGDLGEALAVQNGSDIVVMGVTPVPETGAHVVFAKRISPALLSPARLAKEGLIPLANSLIREEQDFMSFPVSNDEIAGVVVLTDGGVKSAQTLRLDFPRNTYKLGRINLGRALKAMFLLGLLVALISLALVEVFVLRRVSYLGRAMEGIASRFDFKARVNADGRDELSRLSENINGVLEALEVAHSKLEKAHTTLEDEVRNRTRELTQSNEQLKLAMERGLIAEKKIKRLASFVELNPNLVMEFSARGELGYHNPAAQSLAESLGYSGPDLLVPAETSVWVRECLETGKSHGGITSTLGGRTFSWWFHPIAELHVVHCYANDITDRTNLEMQLRQSQKMQSVGQLTAGVAHDFNNLLTVIQGYANLLLSQKNSVTPDAVEPLQEILSASERAANLTSQLLSFSRKSDTMPECLELDEVVESMVKMLKRLLGEHISLTFEKDDQPHRIFADSATLGLVMMNLVVNARDAMPRGGSLTIQTKAVEVLPHEVAHIRGARSGDYIRLSVMDTGCGISADMKQQIFMPFFTTKEAGKGTGLGLATVQRIMQQHDGWIDVESALGKGTTFRLYFPIAGILPVESSPLLSVVQTEREPVKATILIVEDEAPLRELAARILGNAGHQILKASSSVGALKLWKEHHKQIDLLLTDMLLPDGMSGGELAALLRIDNPTLKVICSSGYSSLDVLKNDFLMRDDYHFLPKPYDPRKLAEIVAGCLQGNTAIGVAV